MPDNGFRYHVFISYCQADQPWVQNQLLPLLEKAGISYIDERQFEPGLPRMTEIERAVHTSRRTLLVLTPDYLAGEWENFGSLLASSLSLETGEWLAIPIILKPCKLPERLRMLVPVDLSADEECEWRRLSGAISPSQNTEIQVEPKIALDIETIPIHAGYFWMGCEEDDLGARDDEKPQHRIYLFPYRISKYPITNIQYLHFLKDTHHPTPSHWIDHTIPRGLETHPVVNVSYGDAVAFCRWASRVEGCTYRLPTEEEWEKAARGEDKRRYPWGDQWHLDHCNSSETELGKTTPVKAYESVGASPYGVVDMLGNVAEWTCSWYGQYPRSPSNSLYFGRIQRVVKGGSWIHPIEWARVTFRGHYKPETQRSFLGFRIVSDEV